MPRPQDGVQAAARPKITCTQNSRSGMAEGVTSAKGLPSIPAARRALFTAFAVGQRSTGLPARKSHSKSQRGQTSGDTQLRQATVEAGQVPNEPHRATPSDAREVTGGQGVAGSNPAVPTGSGVFFEIICASREPAKEPSSCEMAPSKARRSGGTASYQGMCQYGRAADGAVKGSKIAEPPRTGTATPPTANRRAPSPAGPANREADAHRAAAAAGWGRPGAQARPATPPWTPWLLA